MRLVKNSYQLFRVTSKRVEGKPNPVLSQKYIGTIDPVKGLLPKKVLVKASSDIALVEYGLSLFIYKHFKRKLMRSVFNAGNSLLPSIKLAIIKFMYGHCEERFVRLSHIGKDLVFIPAYVNDSGMARIDKLVGKINELFVELVPNDADRDYLIALLLDIRISNSLCSKPIEYSDELKAIFIKYKIKYE